MTKQVFRWFSLGVIVWVFTAVSVFRMTPAPKEGVSKRQLTVHLQGVFDAKVSLIPFEGLKAINPIAEVPGVKDGKLVKIAIPAKYLPGEFLLRLDYRVKETDSPYPAERSIYINKQDVEVFVNPRGMGNNDIVEFSAGETENTASGAFMKENGTKRMATDLLRQFLLSYDRTQAEFYTQAVKEFQQRTEEYNSWLSEESKKYQQLYVGRLFQFQYIPILPATAWSGSENERLSQILKHYFDGINFSDRLIIRSRELLMFMDGYIRMHSMQAKTEKQRDELFTQAGRLACEKASKGDPKVYGWMVDYFYLGYETYNITQGMLMLEEHANNPNCLSSKKQQIIKRLEAMDKLVPGALAPDFIIKDNEGNEFELHKYKGGARYKLLLFWSAGCEGCHQLVNGLRQWSNEPANKKKLDIITVSLDETETEMREWETAMVGLLGWKRLYAKGGVNSPVVGDYAILSTPAMFLIESEGNTIVSVPGGLDELIKDLKD